MPLTIHLCGDSMASKLPPHVARVRNKVGRPYLYFTKHKGTAREGKRVRLPDDPTSQEFWAEYAALMGAPAPVIRRDTVRELVSAWQQSPEWLGLSRSTRANWTLYCRRIIEAWGGQPVTLIEPRHIFAFRDKFSATPAAANNQLRCLSSMLSWSAERGWRTDNPALIVGKLKIGNGYEPWPMETIITARQSLLKAGKPEIWWMMAGALYTGQRLGDVLAMRWDAVCGDTVTVRQEKTRKPLTIPLHRDLRPVLDGLPRTAVNVFTSANGLPWTKDGWRSAWRRSQPVCSAAYVFHGLRKSATVMLAEAGCSTAEIASITGQSHGMVEHYAKGANQARLARAAMRRWEG